MPGLLTLHQLTAGALPDMINGDAVRDPVLQVVSLKNIQSNSESLARYKLSLCDSETEHAFSILAPENNSLVEMNVLKVGSVIKLKHYACNVLALQPPKVVIIILDFEIIGQRTIDITTATN